MGDRMSQEHISMLGFEAYITENPDKTTCNLNGLHELYHCPNVLKNICYGMTLTHHGYQQTMQFVFCSKECYKIADHHFDQMFSQGDGHIATIENLPDWLRDEE
jgi:hypothetical protein